MAFTEDDGLARTRRSGDARHEERGGSRMASIEEVRAGIGQANDKAQESLGAPAGALVVGAGPGSPAAGHRGQHPGRRERGQRAPPAGRSAASTRCSRTSRRPSRRRKGRATGYELVGGGARDAARCRRGVGRRAGTRVTPAGASPTRLACSTAGEHREPLVPPSCGKPPTSSTAGSFIGAGDGSPRSRRGCRPVAHLRQATAHPRRVRGAVRGDGGRRRARPAAAERARRRHLKR